MMSYLLQLAVDWPSLAGEYMGLIKSHVVLSGPAVGLDSSCLPGHHFSTHGINWNLTTLSERSFKIAQVSAAAMLYLVIW